MTIMRFTGKTTRAPGGSLTYGVFDVTRVNPTLRAIQNRQFQQRQYYQQSRSAQMQRNIYKQQERDLKADLSAISAQYKESLGTLNKLFGVQNEQFTPRRERIGAEVELRRRRGLRDVGETRAGFGGRGISQNSSLMAGAQREADLLNQIQQSRLQSLDLEEKETGVRQDKARQDLRQQFDNRQRNLNQQIKVLGLRRQAIQSPLTPSQGGIVTTQSLGVVGFKRGPQIPTGFTIF